MSASKIRTNKVVLSDYMYRRDIESRLLLANLELEEVNFLNELFLYSLEIPLADLCHALKLSSETINGLLAKFSALGLYKIERESIILDKERRRYFEFELSKFDSKFVLGIEYLQGLLKRIPPSILPKWYVLPRCCDLIFPSLVEKYFVNPSSYQRNLLEMQYPDPILGKIVDTVFKSPCLKISSQAIQQIFSITAEKFHEWMLFLEFNFVCCLGYERQGDSWYEVVTPFHEWREYLLFQQQMTVTAISDSEIIERTHPKDFGFCEDLTTLLEVLQYGPLKVKIEGTNWTLEDNDIREIFKIYPSSSYASSLIEKAIFMHFACIQDSFLIALPPAKEWQLLDMDRKALTMTRHPIQVEKSLKKVLHSGWVFVEDFLRSFTGILRGKEAPKLINQGKNWKYTLPTYTAEERQLIEKTLLYRLFEAGIVATGTYQGKDCFRVTPFGLSLFE